ncbi:4'-phosphopantetheinyl transferase family protein [Phyllobacterium myrsinacearum]|uniref:Enterobactin synthase component D n=1 Tax=Phyllobacterium myrsinacearum TaxID=28101 RepID=A0A839EGE9_9HYPH|nr:4'-phosphopantetheinyl transferase superfamily protein [Phyllobacterium myrsinacearum]MBA8879041.1 4'-phosphopantetheinyl transferase EntD [Phyllobacterium myrsinacearum]
MRERLPAALSREAALLEAMVAIAPQGIRVGCRVIRDEDEAQLMPAEAHSIPARHPAMRQASGAARWIAHLLLADFGQKNMAVLRSPSGAPVWPESITGSLAHDEEMAVAAVAPVSRIGSIGIDVEPAIPLPDDILALVAIQADVIDAVDANLAGRLLFSAKEAVYKAAYPLDGVILDYEDIAVNLNTGHATTTTGRRATLTYCIAPRIVVLAVVSIHRVR